jgi:hypothetical protein
MKNNKKLLIENKILRERVEELIKTIPILIYDKNPSIKEYLNKEFGNRYS